MLYISIKNILSGVNSDDLSAKREVDFRSDWALSWGRPMSRFTRVARSRVSGQQMSFARKRECNVAMSRFASLQGLICDADPQGVAQPPLQSTTSQE